MVSLDTLPLVIQRQEKEHPGSTGVLSQLLTSLGLAFKVISQLVATAGFKGLYGYTDEKNVHNERQRLLDQHADSVLIDVIKAAHHFGSLVSEEQDKVVMTGSSGGNVGKYAVAFDPLDGSSNIGSNIPVGTIFSIFRRRDPSAAPGEIDFLQKGRDLVAAGYALYGAKTSLVYTTGEGVMDFTLDPSVGEFILTGEQLKIPSEGKIVSVNECYAGLWSQKLRTYLDSFKTGEADFPARYVGSLVADFDRTLRKGGIFLYPANKKYPQGKLRLLYECIPLAFIMEQAGGLAVDGEGAILDKLPQGIHERSALIVGEKSEVERFQREGTPTC